MASDWQLSLSDASRLVSEGAVVLVDLRSPAEFAMNHLKGAISVPFSERSLAERIRNILPEDTPISLIAEGEAQLASAAMQLAQAAFRVAEVPRAESARWQEAGLNQDHLPEISVHELPSRLSGDTGLRILDVREPVEWETGHVPGAILIPLGELNRRWREVPSGVPIAVICEAGVRSCTAASLLLRLGYEKVANVPEGTGGYRKEGFPLAFYRADGESEELA